MTDITTTTDTNSGTIIDTAATIDRLHSDLSDARQLADDRLQVMGRMRGDWETLNAHLNNYADEASMCSTYEDTLEGWNNDFKYFQLEGRQNEYTVSVTVRLTYNVEVPVTTTTTENAEVEVNNMSIDDIMAHADTGSPDDYDWDVTDVSV